MFQVQPIAQVFNSRAEIKDDFWGSILSEIRLLEHLPASVLDGIEQFSHLEIIYIFDKVSEDSIILESQHPRENPNYPKMGILAQRKKNRPNRIGTTIVPLIKHEGRSIWVSHLDAIDQTPVVDIKPILKEFMPQTPITQPAWTHDLMQNYWK